MDDFQWKTGRRDDQIDYFSISLIQLGCLPFCMQIVFDHKGPIKSAVFCFIKLQLFLLASTVCYDGFWHQEMAARDLKSHPVLHHLLLSPPPTYVCVCVYLSVTDKSRFGPNRLCGLVLSLGHVGCQGAHKCPPCLEELSVKMLPPNQSLTGHTRHEFGCENKHKQGIYKTRHLWLGLCSRFGNCM